MDTANEPYPILLEKGKKGELGAKTGKGFYEWTPEFNEARRKKMIKNLVGFVQSRGDSQK
jgi:3-hydroxybutyryl-CoA dehydrogenase